ncbi:MAG: tetratricopeptide repeat protein [Vicinamibacterales bacterium]
MAAVAALAAFVYAGVAGFDFVNWDDPTYVLGNPRVLSGLSWTNLQWALTTSHPPYWHPVTWLSHMLDVTFWGPAPGAAHVVNLAIHATNAVLVFVLLRRTTGAIGASAFVAAVFAVHPLHVESVAWVAERKDVLSTFFALLTMLAYVRFAFRRTSTAYVAMLASFGLALMAKPMTVTLPVLLLLLDVWPLRRLPWPSRGEPGSRPLWIAAVVEKLPLAAMALATAVLTVAGQSRVGAMMSLEQLSWPARLANALVGYAWYLKLVFWPAGLAAFHPPRTWPAVTVALSAALCVVVTALAIRMRRTRPHLLVGWLFFLAGLAPVIGLLQAGDQAVAERFVYLPLLGPTMALAWEARSRVRDTSMRAAVAVLVVAAAALAARAQVPAWSDSVTLWTRTIAATGGSSRAFENLAQALRERGDYDPAIANYVRALDAAPGARPRYRAGILNAMGITERARGSLDGSYGYFARAVDADGTLTEARLNLGNALAARGDLASAEIQLTEALNQQGDLTEALVGLGSLLLQQGRNGEAETRYRRALELAPGMAEAHNGLGAARMLLGDLDTARTQFTAAIELKPGLASAHLNLGLVLARAGETDAARRQLQTALVHDPTLQAARAALAALDKR